jgi:hypothetical protein
MTDPKPVHSDVNTQLLLQRAHKSALGFAFGMIGGLLLFAVTAFHVTFRIDGLPLYLLNQFFQGYEVSWKGAFIGLGWGFAVGFVGGWLLGFIHNFTVGIWMLIVRAKRDLGQTGNFLDHI